MAWFARVLRSSAAETAAAIASLASVGRRDGGRYGLHRVRRPTRRGPLRVAWPL